MHALSNGTIVDGRYELLGKLGEGGFGSVYKARHKQFDRIVALKILNPDLLLESDGLARFEREAKAMAALKHKNIISLYAYGTYNQAPYMVLEYVEGRSLDTLLMGGKQLPLPQAASILAQVCDGMECAHANGIVHRDLKPSNIMIVRGPDGKDLVKLIDFGLARLLPGYGVSAQKLTEAGCALGTCAYMAPEQCTGEEVDNLADIYAAGCIFYHCLEGRRPYDGDDNIAVMFQQLNSPPPKTSWPAAQPVIDRAMSKEKKSRYPSAAEMRADLQLLAASSTGLATMQRTSRSRPSFQISKPVLFGTLAVIAVSLMVAWYAAVSQQKNTEHAPVATIKSSTELYALWDPLTPEPTEKYRDAIEALQRQFDADHLLDPEKQRVMYHKLATYYLQKRDYQRAQNYLDKGLEVEQRITPHHREHWQFMLKQAAVWLGTHREEKGLKLLRELRRNQGETPYTRELCGFAGTDLFMYYMDRGQYDAAVQEITETLKCGPFGSGLQRELLNSRARAETILGDYDAAFRDIDEAIQDHSTDEEYLMHLARMEMLRILLATKRYDRVPEAAADISDFRKERDARDAYWLQIAAAARVKDRAKSEEWVSRLIADRPLTSEHADLCNLDWGLCVDAVKDSGYDDLLAKLMKTPHPRNAVSP